MIRVFRSWTPVPVIALSIMLVLLTACGPAPAPTPTPAPAKPAAPAPAPTQAPAKPAAPTQAAPKPTAAAPAPAQPTAAPKPAAQPTAAPKPAQAAPDKVIFMLDWVPQGRFAPFYYAQVKGIYKENNIEIDLPRGYGGGQTAKTVDQGQVQFGLADISPVILLQAEGSPVRAIGMYHHIGAQGIASLKSTGIKAPKDMEGKSFGITAGSPFVQLLPVFAKVNNFDVNKVKILTIDAAAYTAALLQKRVDAIGTFYASNVPRLTVAAKDAGDEASYIFFKDAGVDIYSSAFLTTEKVMKEKPDLVRRFLKATYQGIDEAIANPNAAVDATVKLHPDLDKDRKFVAEEWAQAVELLKKEPALGTGYGLMTEEKMKHTRDLLLTAYGSKADLPLNRVYTNEFVPGFKR